MAVIPIQDVRGGNLDVTFGSANSGGDSVQGGTAAAGWGRDVLLIVQNGHNAAQTVTVVGNGVHEIGAGDTAVIPVEGGVHGNGRAVTYSGVVSLTVAAVRVSR